jgi:hypothetical protein
MRKVDVSAYSAQKPRKIKPEKVDLGDLPPIQKPPPKPKTDKVQTHNRAKAQSHKPTDAQSHESTNVQNHKRANVHDYRPIVRKTLDLFLDQSEMIETWRARMRRDRGGRSVTQGEAAREVFDFFKEAKGL